MKCKRHFENISVETNLNIPTETEKMPNFTFPFTCIRTSMKTFKFHQDNKSV